MSIMILFIYQQRRNTDNEPYCIADEEGLLIPVKYQASFSFKSKPIPSFSVASGATDLTSSIPSGVI